MSERWLRRSCVALVVAMALVGGRANMGPSGPALQWSCNRTMVTMASAETALKWDYGFIALYALFFILGGALSWQWARLPTTRWSPIWRALAVLAVFAIICAAIADIVENRHVALMLNGDHGCPHPWARAKFLAFFVSLAALAPMYRGHGNTVIVKSLGCLVIGLSLWAAGFGIYGAIFEQPTMIASDMSSALVTLALSGLYLGTYKWLAGGLLKALNGMADTRVLGWMTKWPDAF